MRRTKRMFLAGLLSLSALVPVVALAATSTTAYVAGAEYALGTCVSGVVAGETGSFAGYASAPGGAPNAVFNTTICHSPLGGFASILAGGSFTLVKSDLTLVGQYVRGTVRPGAVSGKYFCKEVFQVTAELGPAGSVPEDATNISGGLAVGSLTHYGVLTNGACRAYAATITGQATLYHS